MYSPSKNLFSGLASSKVEINKDGRIKRFIENRNKNVKKNRYVNTGAYILNKRILKKIPKGKFYDFSSDLFPKLINKSFFGYLIEKKGYCLGMDTPNTYKKTVRIIEDNNLF